MRILVGADGSESSNVACRFLASRAWPLDTIVELIGAYDNPVDWAGIGHAASDAANAELEALEYALLDQAASLRRAGLHVETTIMRGRAEELLSLRAAESFADLVAVGSRGRGPIASAMLGSVSAHLVDHAPCPVLVARSSGATRMLLAADGSSATRDIPRILSTWGNALRGLPVDVLSVARHIVLFEPLGPVGVPQPGASDEYRIHEGIAAEMANEMRDRGWQAVPTVSVGDPEHEILAAAGRCKADLIVTGSRGLGTIRRLAVGSVSHDLLLHGHSSLLVMRGHVPAVARNRVAVAGPAFT